MEIVTEEMKTEEREMKRSLLLTFLMSEAEYTFMCVFVCVCVCVCVIMKEYNEDYNKQEWLSYSGPLFKNEIGLHPVDISNTVIYIMRLS